ncbi:MAG: histidine kinase [Bacteroidales bacterium]|nr:histidine kinase [Bacteroidales bacterium]
MDLFIFKNWYYRILSGALAGLMVWLLVEVGFTIRYRYFELFTDASKYLYAMAYGVLILESIYRVWKWIDKYQYRESSPGRRFFLQSLSGVLIALFWILLVRLSLNYLVSPGKLIIFIDEMMILFLVIFLILTLNFADLGHFLVERYRKSLAELEKFRKENAEYQFEMLKLQLNPHFLFNSLNVLSSLVYEDQAKSAEFIRRLSDVYRYVLDNRHKELVTLREEMEFIRAFTFLQGLRFQGMIDFRFNINDSLLDRKIAPMTLQLLVENAVKHNVASRKMPLWIEVVTGENDIIITNNLQPKEEQAGTGVGLKNIISRYKFLSGRKVQIINENLVFKVVIPLI